MLAGEVLGWEGWREGQLRDVLGDSLPKQQELIFCVLGPLRAGTLGR